MDIFYSDIINSNKLELSSIESHHCSTVLRHNTGDQIEVLDGVGNKYICRIRDDNKKKIVADIISKEFYAPNKYNLHLIIAPTKSHDRIEWFVEKSIEIGVSEISFIKTKRTERSKININRINKISISAMKQSGQYYLPSINNLNSFKEIISNRSEEQLFIGHLEPKSRKKYIVDIYEKNRTCCIMIGPEGDFTIDEINLAIANNFEPISLGNSRLRTETAGIYAVSIVKILNEDR